jgi:hypothetical protein
MAESGRSSCRAPESQTAGSVLPYRLGMPARKLPTPQDTAAARRVLLDGLARDSDLSELAGELAPLHPRDDTFPGEVLLQVAADVLDWCGASRSDPLALGGMGERLLPELALRGKQNKKLQYSILAAAGCAAERSRTCLTRSAGGRPTTSGSTRCTRRSPISAPQLVEWACRCARYPRNWRGATAFGPNEPSLRTLVSGSQVASLVPGQAAWPSLTEPEA